MNRKIAWGAVAIAIGVAAFLRFDALGEPSYWLDEILGQMVVHRAPSIPWWQWITGLHPQHGPLYYALQCLAFVLRDDEWGGRLFVALFGVISVPLLWMVWGTRASLFAAALLAISPVHVYYSREARPYALIVMLVIVALLAILRRAPVVAGAAFVLLLYTSVASASAVASLACAAFAAAFVERDRASRRRLFAIALIAVLVLALFPLLYRSTTEERAVSPFPGLTASLVDSIVRGLSVTALDSLDGGRTAYFVLLLAIAGAIALVRRNRSAAVVVIAMACLPIVFSVAGLLAQNHFFGIRYVIAALPAFLLLAGFGLATLLPFWRGVVGIAIVAAIGLQTWPMARTEAFQKLDWRGIAQRIDRYAHADDVVLTAEPWSGLALHYYLERLPSRVLDLQVSTVPLAQVAVQEHAGAWLVSGGFNPDVAVRAWMCNFPVVLASPLENFRMHYTSRGGGSFLRERATPAEWRAAAATFGKLEMTPQEDLFLGEGWAGPEGTFRWAVGERATIVLPRSESIRMRVSPLDHPSLPPQTMRVFLNDRELQTFTLKPGWQELTVSALADALRDGANVLAFQFGRATAPAEFDPVNRDARKLAVAFDWITFGDGDAIQAIAVRMPPLPEKKYATATRFPASHLNRKHVEALLGRIGFDPTTTWPRIASGEVRLEDLIEIVAYGTDCVDDATFIRQTFTLLIGRPPGDAEVQGLMRVPRERVVGRISKFDEFRKNVSQ